MATTLHKNSTYDQNHAPHSFEVADQTALDALTPTALDVKKVALKLDDDTYYRLDSYDPIVWTKLGNVTTEQLALKQDILSDGAFVDGDKTKLDFITATEDINLDTLESFRIQTEQKFTDTNEPTGFIREFKETIGYIELCTDGTKVISVDWNGVTTIRSNGLWVDGTNANAREFAITPVPYSGTIDIISEEDGSVTNRADTRDTSINGGEYYSVYIEGTKLNITTQQVVALPDQSGLQFIYHELNGDLGLATSFSFEYFEDRPITATVYGNATTQELVNFGDERHGIQMDGFTHRYLHFTQGTQYVSGMGLNGVTNGSTTYTSIDAGKAYDEDIYMSPLSQTSSPFVYRDSQFWTVLDDGLEIAYLSGGIAQFNCDTNYVNYGVAGVDYTPSGSYELRDVTGNDRMIMFFVLTNNKEFPYVKILGQKVYTNSLEARADVGTAVNDLILSGLPSPEFLPIYAVIVDDTGAVDDISSDEVYVDLRGAKISGSGSISGVTTSHGDLTGKEAADQHPISAITDLQNTLDGKVQEAPMDGVLYGRRNGAWESIEPILKIDIDSSLTPTTADEMAIYLATVTSDVTIDWGDGTIDTATAVGFYRHTYSVSGLYTVKITGDIHIRLSQSGGPFDLFSYHILGVDWDRVKFIDMDSMFMNVKSNFTLTGTPDTSSVTDMRYMFTETDAFNQPLNFDTSSVTTMSYMFSNSIFNQPLDFDTSSVTNMKGMFYGSSFNQPLNFNTSSVTDMSSMFLSAAFNQDISGWNVAAVTVCNDFKRFSSLSCANTPALDPACTQC
jgi:hypothetical protein